MSTTPQSNLSTLNPGPESEVDRQEREQYEWLESEGIDHDLPSPAIWKTATQTLQAAEAIDWIVEDFVAEQVVTLLSALPKAGKSTFISAMIGAMSRGEDFLGRATRPVGTLYLSETPDSAFGVNARRFGLGDDVHVMSSWDTYGWSFEHVVNKVLTKAEATGAGLVVVDTLSAWARIADENAVSDANRAAEEIRRLSQAGLATVVLHHKRKSAGSFGASVRGSTAITASVDIVVELDHRGSDHDAPRTVSTAGRYESPGVIVIDLVGSGYEVLEEADAGYCGRCEQLARVLSDAPQPASALARSAGLPETTVRRHLDDLVAAGRALPREGRPRRWSLPSPPLPDTPGGGASTSSPEGGEADIPA